MDKWENSHFVFYLSSIEWWEEVVSEVVSEMMSVEWWEEVVSEVVSVEWWEEVVSVSFNNNYCIMASISHIVTTVGRSIRSICIYWLC
ncbi:hypothetical protein [Methanobacterium sp.]|uniref:hypothetical protein n=1 Tax=Methanobacterium sp. TaxID=2164 RepID=UPI003C745623